MRPFDPTIKPQAQGRRMRVVIACAFLGLILAVSSGATKSLRNVNLQSFDLVWQTVLDTHFDPTFVGVD